MKLGKEREEAKEKKLKERSRGRIDATDGAC